MHAPAIHVRQTDRQRHRALPVHLRQPERRPRASRVTRPSGAHRAERDRTSLRSKSPGLRTFVAGRRRGKFCDWSHVRTIAQSCAQLESPRARGPYIAGGEFSPPTGARTDALQSKLKRSLAAYGVNGNRRSISGTPRLSVHGPTCRLQFFARRGRRMPAV